MIVKLNRRLQRLLRDYKCQIAALLEISCTGSYVFSNSRGEVCVIEPLHMNLAIKDHPLHDVSILIYCLFLQPW